MTAIPQMLIVSMTLRFSLWIENVIKFVFNYNCQLEPPKLVLNSLCLSNFIAFRPNRTLCFYFISHCFAQLQYGNNIKQARLNYQPESMWQQLSSWIICMRSLQLSRFGNNFINDAAVQCHFAALLVHRTPIWFVASRMLSSFLSIQYQLVVNAVQIMSST